MKISFDDPAVQNAILKSFELYGKKRVLKNIDIIKKGLKASGIYVDDDLRLLQEKPDKQTAYSIIYNHAVNDDLTSEELMIVFRSLTKLKIRKHETAQLIISTIMKCISDDLDDVWCWDYCDKLYSLGCKEFKADYIYIASCKKLGEKRQMIFLLMGKTKDPDYIDVLIEALKEPGISGHAISALDKFGDIVPDDIFVPFLDDDRNWVRDVAKKRLKKLS